MRHDETNGSPQGPLVLVARPRDVLRTMDRRTLTAAERRRGAALRHPADRDCHAAAHLLVRYCAAALTGRAVGGLDVVQRCTECGSADHGRPSVAGLPGLHVSLAHTRGAVVAAADLRPVGVDVEGLRARAVDPAVMAYALTAAEADEVRAASDPSTAFLRHWVRKESLVKVGVAGLDRLSSLSIDPATERDLGAGRTAGRFGPLHVVDWVDGALDVVVAAAGWRPPVVRSFTLGVGAGAAAGSSKGSS